VSTSPERSWQGPQNQFRECRVRHGYPAIEYKVRPHC
jgi:hypothetical protein